MTGTGAWPRQTDRHDRRGQQQHAGLGRLPTRCVRTTGPRRTDRGRAAPGLRAGPRVRHASQRCADCLMGTAEGMRAYSMYLRERVVAAVDRGMTQEQAAVTFGVSVNTVGRSLTRRRNTGSLAPTAYRHGPRPEKTQRLQAWLPARLQVAADATLTEHAAAFTAEEGLVVSLSTMSRAITTLRAYDPAEALTPAGRRRRPGRPLKSKV